LAELILAGIAHKGFSLIDVLQPCVSFNKLNTYEWYAKRVYKVGPEHDPADKAAARALAEQRERLPLGVLYSKPGPDYGELSGLDALPPLADADLSAADITGVLQDFR